MKILITGICGFVGSSLALRLREQRANTEIIGIDNLIRPGSEKNRRRLSQIGCRVFHGDVRIASDFETVPSVDWVIDAAANPSVLAGIDGKSSSRQVIEHNLGGTINLLEYSRRCSAGFILLSTSRVYSIRQLAALPLERGKTRFEFSGGTVVPASSSAKATEDRSTEMEGASESQLPNGVSAKGVSEEFSTNAPISLYGATKLSSEILALEYGQTFQFPVRINRCGVLAGAGQFGTAEQGIFSYWVHAWRSERPLKYLGFDGSGLQVRDAFHPDDLAALIDKQIGDGMILTEKQIWNVGGGAENSMSLVELSARCADRFGNRQILKDERPRPFDIPWLVMDWGRAKSCWGWEPRIKLDAILEEIAKHAEENPDWLEICGA
jgi:CDP-paratose 2-epimerase